MRANGRNCALANNDDMPDDAFPSLEELCRACMPTNVSTGAFETDSPLQRLEQPVLRGPGMQVERAQSESAGDSRDRPVILDNDDADMAGAGDDGDTGRLERDASLHFTSESSELAFPAKEPIDTSGPWYDVEEGCYVDEPAQGLDSLVPPTLAQPQALPRSFEPLQDLAGLQGADNISQTTLVEFHTLPEPSAGGDDGWTDENTAELERDLGRALGDPQVESSSADTPTLPSPRSVDALTQSRERTQNTDGRGEERQDTSRCGTGQTLEELEQRESGMVVEERDVDMQQQAELAVQNEVPRQLAVGNRQDLDEVVNTDPKDKGATEALPPAQHKIPEVDSHRFRLRGLRARQLNGCQTKTAQYRLIWGKNPTRSEFWANECDVRLSMARPSCEPHSQNLALRAEMEICRVCEMRSSQRGGRKVFEYLVDVFGLDNCTWISEDQLTILPSRKVVAMLHGPSHSPVSQAQRDVLLRHSQTPTRDEPSCDESRASRSSCAQADSALDGELATLKGVQRDASTDISSDTHDSMNTDDNHDACDTSDEDARPAKRRKRRTAPAATPPEINERRTQADDGILSTFVVNNHQCASKTSRSPSMEAEGLPVAEYREWPFKGFLKRTRIGNNVTYNLEFKLPLISEDFCPRIDPADLDTCPGKEPPAKISTNPKAVAHFKVHQSPLQHKARRAKGNKWTPEEDATVLQMRKDGCSWKEIRDALPHWTIGSTQVRYSTKLKGQSC